MLPDARRAALFACWFSAVTSAVFFVTGVVALPVPLYVPLVHRWVISASAAEQLGPLGSLTMDYFGRSLLAVGCGAVTTLLGMICLRLRHRTSSLVDGKSSPGTLRKPSSIQLQLALAYAVTAFLLCAALFAYKLYGREPSSPVLPDPSPTSADRLP